MMKRKRRGTLFTLAVLAGLMAAPLAFGQPNNQGARRPNGPPMASARRGGPSAVGAAAQPRPGPGGPNARREHAGHPPPGAMPPMGSARRLPNARPGFPGDAGPGMRGPGWRGPRPDGAKMMGARRAKRRHLLREYANAWGRESLERPDVQTALKVHAWRMARLRRAQALATEKDDAKLTETIQELMAKERSRFARRMAQLTGKDSTASPSTASSAVPTVRPGPPQPIAPHPMPQTPPAGGTP